MKTFTISDKIIVKKSEICPGKGVFAKKNINKSEIIIDAEADIITKPNPYTLQIGKSKYLFAKYVDNIINHSCSPNVFLRLYKNNVKRYSYVALKNIKKGQELFWNYNTNDWDVARSFAFPCNCGSKNCVKVARGMKYLTKLQQTKLSPISTPFIRKKLILTV